MRIDGVRRMFVLYWVIAWVVLLVAGGMALARATAQSWRAWHRRRRGRASMVVHQVIVLRRAGLLATEGVTSFLVDTVGGAAQQSLGVGLFRAPVIATIVAFIVWQRKSRGPTRARPGTRADATPVAHRPALSCTPRFGGGYLSRRAACPT